MSGLLEAELVADRRCAWYELVTVLGGPSRWHHRRADALLDRIAQADAALSGVVEVIRWR